MPAVYAPITGSGTVPTGGTTGQQLTKNSNTNYDIGWAAAGSGGGGSPGGSDTQVQFNDAGAFGGDAGMVYDKTNDILGLGASSAAAPGLEFHPSGGQAWAIWSGGSTGAATYVNPNELAFYNGGTGNTPLVLSSGTIYVGSSIVLGWQNAGHGGTVDTAFARNAAGVVEINNGTAGTYQDLKLRNLILSGGTQIPAASPTGLFLKDDGTYAAAGGGGGNVSNSGTPAANQVAIWTDATHIEGGAELLADNYLRWTYAGAARTGLIIENTDATSKSCQITFRGSGVSQWEIINDAASTGALNFVIRDVPTSGNPNRLYIDSNGTRFPSDNYVGWSSVAGNTVAAVADTALSRNAAGVVEINNGTAGTLRDLTIRNLTLSGTLTGGERIPRISSQASGATWSPNADTTDIFTITTAQAAAVTTISNPSGTGVDGQKMVFRVKCDGTARALSGWGTQYRASSDMALPATLIANKTTYLGFMYNSVDTKWDMVSKMENF